MCPYCIPKSFFFLLCIFILFSILEALHHIKTNTHNGKTRHYSRTHYNERIQISADMVVTGRYITNENAFDCSYKLFACTDLI
jgi:hypothetical protein